MTEPIPTPDDDPTPVPAAAEPPAARWYNRRVPLVAVGFVLLAGCLLGAGVTALGAVVVAHVHHGHGDKWDHRDDPRPHRVEKWDRRGEGPRGFGDRRGPGGSGPVPPAPPFPQPATPSPAAS